MTDWECFIKEKLPVEGENFERQFVYQCEMFHNIKKSDVHSLTRAQLDIMFSDWQTDDGYDHQEPESDSDSSIIFSWHKDKNLQRRGQIGPSHLDS